jgi:hypothetical protein
VVKIATFAKPETVRGNFSAEMSEKNERKKQHTIPKVYLKHFKIDNDLNRSYVYCIDFNGKKIEVQKKGFKDPIFKQKKFYNNPKFKDPFLIENVFGENFEPKYEKIMKVISNEEKIDEDIMSDLIFWLYISKMRSPYLREDLKDKMSWYFETYNSLNNISQTIEEKEEQAKYIDKYAREIHLSSFAEEEQVKKLYEIYVKTLSFKEWIVLKSSETLPFWTNDNPGFSINTNLESAIEKPFHFNLEMNSTSINCFVLSPKYCLLIKPFMGKTDFMLNKNLTYESASINQINLINYGVFYTKQRTLISNSSTLLNECVKTIK